MKAVPEIFTGFWRIFSAAIFGGTDLDLEGEVEPGKLALEIPTHREFAGQCQLACIQHGRLTTSDYLVDDMRIKERKSEDTG